MDEIPRLQEEEKSLDEKENKKNGGCELTEEGENALPEALREEIKKEVGESVQEIKSSDDMLKMLDKIGKDKIKQYAEESGEYDFEEIVVFTVLYAIKISKEEKGRIE
jgi:hypothetical protein